MATSIGAVTRATTIVHGGSATLEEYRGLLRALKGMKRFGLARRLLRRARQDMSVPTDSAARLYLGQQLALCTNKDLDSRAQLEQSVQTVDCRTVAQKP